VPPEPCTRDYIKFPELSTTPFLKFVLDTEEPVA
jgi:hypothetical protein